MRVSSLHRSGGEEIGMKMEALKVMERWEIVSSGFVSAILGQMTYSVASLAFDSTRTYDMLMASSNFEVDGGRISLGSVFLLELSVWKCHGAVVLHELRRCHHYQLPDGIQNRVKIAGEAIGSGDKIELLPDEAGKESDETKV
ncbi:hypothetical protein Tco_1109207 [Tanacetum coccineum]